MARRRGRERRFAAWGLPVLLTAVMAAPDVAAQDAAVQSAIGQSATAEEVTGQGPRGRGWPGEHWADQVRTSQAGADQARAAQVRAAQAHAAQTMTVEDTTDQHPAAETGTRAEDPAVQNTASRNTASQNSTDQHPATETSTPAQNTATQNTATETSTPQNTASQDPAVQNTASQNTASQNTDNQNTASQNTASQNTDNQNTDNQNTDNQNTASQNTASPNTASQDPADQTSATRVQNYQPPPYYARSPARQDRSFTLAATGDLLIHTPVRTRAALPGGGFDFVPQLVAAAEHLSREDLALCHLEVPLDRDSPYSSYPVFNAPTELATAIATVGWDICSTASNHSADKGFGGLVNTLDALDQAGVAARGTYRTEEDSLATPLLLVAGARVGNVSATYGLNGIPAPGGHEWSVLRIDPAAILDRVRALRAANADVVIVSLHWGNEYQHAPSAFQRQVAEQLMTGGEVDAIIGHHAHVIQPVEWIGGRPVVYGLGNFLSGQRPTERRDGAIARLSFVEEQGTWRVDEVTAQPTRVDDAYRVQVVDPDDPGALGESARRTLGYMGVPLPPPPPEPSPHPAPTVAPPPENPPPDQPSGG